MVGSTTSGETASTTWAVYYIKDESDRALKVKRKESALKVKRKESPDHLGHTRIRGNRPAQNQRQHVPGPAAYDSNSKFDKVLVLLAIWHNEVDMQS